ncbi:hypothetical protein PQX77_013880 [Marasmius sp. AFHP31]|nr:hypothetical protein PQX77_013880 [Marasmius sp. AFHP31]
MTPPVVRLNQLYDNCNLISIYRRGRMILVHNGRFHYPARLIEQASNSYWLVQFWRGNIPASGAKHTPGDYQEVHVQTIVDAFLGNTEERRSIRLGLFRTTREINSHQNEIEEGKTPQLSQRYTAEIHRALESHTEALRKLIFTPESCNPADYPSLQYRKGKKTRIVPFTGGLPHTTRSKVKNWMYNKIPGLKEREDLTWLTDGGLQEALMRLIAHRDREEFTILKDCPKTGHKKQRFIFAKAWERLDCYTGRTQDGRPQPVVEDVDKQALSLLKDAMFLPDLNPGPPGQQQWGLDVGIHQDNRDP